MAVGYLTVLGDVTESYNLGKTARRLNKSQKVKYKLDLECHAISMINIYKEPMQSSSALLKDIQEMAMRVRINFIFLQETFVCFLLLMASLLRINFTISYNNEEWGYKEC